MQFRSFAPFLLISFGLAWSILGLYVFLPERMGAVFGQLTGNHPLFYLAVYAPAIAAFTLVARTGGLAGLRSFLRRALLWRCSASWYAFLIIGIPLIFIGGSALRGNIFTEPFPFVSVPLWAGLILGAIWGLWHLPAFLLSGTQQSEWSFTAFFAGCLAISVIATALFNRSHGSILLSAFFHFSLMNPVFPDAQPYDIYLLIVVAAMIVWRKRKDMFTREGAVVEVIPSGKAADG
jgi:hypothetical protein